MIAEAATVEAIWVVEPPLLEDMFAKEITAFCAEQVPRMLYILSLSRSER